MSFTKLAYCVKFEGKYVMYHAGEIECFDAGHVTCFVVVFILVFVVPFGMWRYMKYLRKKPIERHYWEVLAPLLLNYRDDVWFQSVINIFRRGVLICLPLVPITDLGGRAALISFAMGLLLATHCYLMPYKFTVINQQLRDSALGDLSKLPSTLQRLSLAGNQIHQLTTLDVASLPRDLKILFVRNNQLTELDLLRLPRGLEYLGVDGNNLTELDVTKLPPTLITLMAGHNKLSAIDLTKLPRNLDTLSLTNNNLLRVDLSQLPPVMWYIGLSRNHLDDSHFETLPSDRMQIQVHGKGNQKNARSMWV